MLSRIVITVFSDKWSQAQLQAYVDEAIKHVIVEHGEITVASQDDRGASCGSK